MVTEQQFLVHNSLHAKQYRIGHKGNKMAYSYNVKMICAKGTTCEVDTSAKYGYWERQDGSEGGGLWFETSDIGNKGLELIDYDGIGELPSRIVMVLRESGFYVDDSF